MKDQLNASLLAIRIFLDVLTLDLLLIDGTTCNSACNV
jgi:hypothetical protein